MAVSNGINIRRFVLFIYIEGVLFLSVFLFQKPKSTNPLVKKGFSETKDSKGKFSSLNRMKCFLTEIGS